MGMEGERAGIEGGQTESAEGAGSPEPPPL
jgi:hypothetical protein